MEQAEGHCLATQGAVRLMDWGRRQEHNPLPDRLERQWQRWWEQACILHGKQNWVTGLAWRIILVQRAKPNALLQYDMGCDLELATRLLLFQERQSCLSDLSKCGKNLGGEQGEPSRFSFHFLSFPFAHEPLFAWRHRSLSWAQLMVTAGCWGHGQHPRVSPDVWHTHVISFHLVGQGLGTLHDIGATAPMPPGLWGPHWLRQWCWPRVITIRKARAGRKQNYCSHLAEWERKESKVDSYGCSGEKINSSVFKGSRQHPFKGTYISVDKQAGHQSCTHALQNAQWWAIVFVSNKGSYCSYVHHFIQYALSGSVLKQP